MSSRRPKITHNAFINSIARSTINSFKRIYKKNSPNIQKLENNYQAWKKTFNNRKVVTKREVINSFYKHWPH
jgi:hypothetical protein